MKFEVGQKVETPFGKAEIVFLDDIPIKWARVKIPNNHEWLYPFNVDDLKPYKTPHEKLIELGFKFYNSVHTKSIISDSGYHILIHKKSKEIGILGKALTFELWKIFDEYLEWLWEEK